MFLLNVTKHINFTPTFLGAPDNIVVTFGILATTPTNCDDFISAACRLWPNNMLRTSASYTSALAQ